MEDCPWPPDWSKAVEHRLLLAIKHRQHHLSPSPSTPRLSSKRKVSLPTGIFPKACSFPLQDTRSPSPQSPAPEPSDHLPHFGMHLPSSPPPPPLTQSEAVCVIYRLKSSISTPKSVVTHTLSASCQFLFFHPLSP